MCHTQLLLCTNRHRQVEIYWYVPTRSVAEHFTGTRHMDKRCYLRPVTRKVEPLYKTFLVFSFYVCFYMRCVCNLSWTFLFLEATVSALIEPCTSCSRTYVLLSFCAGWL